MNVNVKFWLTEVVVSLFLVFGIVFIGDNITVALLSTGIALLAYYFFRKDEVDFTRLARSLSIGIIILWIIANIVGYFVSRAILSQLPPNSVVGIFKPIFPDALISLIVTLIFFNLPFILKDRIPNKYFRIFVWIVLVMIALFLIILPIIRLYAQLRSVSPI